MKNSPVRDRNRRRQAARLVGQCLDCRSKDRTPVMEQRRLRLRRGGRRSLCQAGGQIGSLVPTIIFSIPSLNRDGLDRQRSFHTSEYLTLHDEWKPIDATIALEPYVIIKIHICACAILSVDSTSIPLALDRRSI